LLYARVDLSKTNYIELSNYQFIDNPNIEELDKLYIAYCRHKKFRSVMPIFAAEYTDPNSDIIGYYDKDKLVAFSLIKRYSDTEAECVQFAWDYANPKLRLGMRSLKNECAIYKRLGFQYLYLGGADEYKKGIDGFEILGPA
jgi:arginyl-tRNA--protein-N-Asp/Glu arginylyltransferase